MLNEGLALMATGMGTVFSFLVILWGSVALMGAVVGWLNKICPAEVETIQNAVKKVSADVEVAIAVAAAKIKR